MPELKTYFCLMMTTLLVVTMCNPLTVLPVRGAQDCEAALTQASRHYIDGRFNEVITSLQPCLAQDSIPETRVQMLRLLGLTYLAMDSIALARQSIADLIETDPQWSANPVQDPPRFVEIVEEIKQRAQEMAAEAAEPAKQEEEAPGPTVEPVKKGGSKALLWIGLGAAAIGGGLAVGLSGGGSDGGPGPDLQLPGPPGGGKPGGD